MANTKISAFPASTTPLAGTEVLPIVKSGANVKVAVSDLTAGRAVNALSLAVTQGITGGSGFQISGFTSYRSSGASASSPGDAAIYYNAATGYTLQARAGSSYDWSLINPGNANYIARVPTGTLNLEITNGNLVQGTAAKGINFTANTPASGMTSQLLNWYEEGTWTPTDNSGAGLSITNNSARYTRVGRQVSLVASITYPVTANGSNAQIGGFPFSSGATPIPCNIGYATVALALMSYMNGAGTAASFFTPGANVTNATMSGATVFFTATYFA